MVWLGREDPQPRARRRAIPRFLCRTHAPGTAAAYTSGVQRPRAPGAPRSDKAVIAQIAGFDPERPVVILARDIKEWFKADFDVGGDSSGIHCALNHAESVEGRTGAINANKRPESAMEARNGG